VIPLAWILQAQQRWIDYFGHARGTLDAIPGRRIYGADIARFGTDETAIAIRQGDAIAGVERIGQQDTMTTALRLKAKLEYPQSIAVVDVIGVGAGVVDRLREEHQNVQAFNASASANGM